MSIHLLRPILKFLERRKVAKDWVQSDPALGGSLAHGPCELVDDVRVDSMHGLPVGAPGYAHLRSRTLLRWIARRIVAKCASSLSPTSGGSPSG